MSIPEGTAALEGAPTFGKPPFGVKQMSRPTRLGMA